MVIILSRIRTAHLAPVIVVALLVGVAVDKVLFHLPEGDPEPYHAQIREVADKLPYQIGDWVGTDVDVPPAAVALLKPNVILNRRFKDVRTGQMVTFLLVQCGDARDLLGHYPPVCYRVNGWALQAKTPRDWQVDDVSIRGVEYEFSKSTFERSTRIIINNFMVLPDGIVARDMESVGAVAQDPRKKLFGAAQIQLLFGADIPVSERDEIFKMFMKANISVIKTIYAEVGSES